jgi:hypothetical protein
MKLASPAFIRRGKCHYRMTIFCQTFGQVEGENRLSMESYVLGSCRDQDAHEYAPLLTGQDRDLSGQF